MRWQCLQVRKATESQAEYKIREFTRSLRQNSVKDLPFERLLEEGGDTLLADDLTVFGCEVCAAHHCNEVRVACRDVLEHLLTSIYSECS